MDFVKQEVFSIDVNTELEFLNRKTVIVIDKERFSILKQFMMENANDEDFASFLSIPIAKVPYFKYKMQLFEDSIRVRRRVVKLDKRKVSRAKPRKREISSEERFRRARELISKNLSTNQISKILKVSERSVTRFKRRMREEKKRLKAEGKIAVDPNDPDDENSFRHLPLEEKIRTAKELFRKRLKVQEISEILKISERSVRRWKIKLSKAKVESRPTKGSSLKERTEVQNPPKRAKVEPEEDKEDLADQELSTELTRKKRHVYVDREKVQYARELIENNLSNKEMSLLLEMSIACVRKLKTKILDGTAEELIDNSEEHYSNLNSKDELSTEGKDDADPLQFIESVYNQYPVSATSSFGYERKPKVVLRDREMFIARLLRENNVRTMDIAKIMKISERSVTRLLARAKDSPKIDYDTEIVEEVERLMAAKDEILNEPPPQDLEFIHPTETKGADDSKRQLGANLLAMNVKIKDIAKMLDASERTVQRWKMRIQQLSRRRK